LSFVKIIFYSKREKEISFKRIVARFRQLLNHMIHPCTECLLNGLYFKIQNGLHLKLFMLYVAV